MYLNNGVEVQYLFIVLMTDIEALKTAILLHFFNTWCIDANNGKKHQQLPLSKVLNRVARSYVFEWQKSQFGVCFEGLVMEKVRINYCHLLYITIFWYILKTVCIFCGSLVQFCHFGMLSVEKSGTPSAKFIF
jgi:hypothetical protein